MAELPPDVVDEAARLTRLERAAVDDAEAAAYRADRDDILAEHGFHARVREDGSPPVLLCYPTDWAVDGTVDSELIQDPDRAAERPLQGAGDPADWARVESHNRAIADAVEAEHGPVHGATAGAFADFMGNHYARRLESAGPRECREFLEEYLPRNAWPSDEQLARAEASLRLAFESAGVEPPPTVEPGSSER